MNSLRRVPLRDAAVIAVALLSIAILSVLNQPRSAEHPVTYSSYDAAGGGYRAWYELLQREGVAAARFEERAAFLDRSVGTLVVGDPPAGLYADMTRADVAALAAWVKGGGHVVVVGDGLMSLLLHADLKLPQTTDRAQRRLETGGVSRELRAAGVRRIEPATTQRIVARRTDATLMADGRGALVVRYPFGRGVVVDAIDGAPFSNERIGTPDNARLALAVVTSPAARTVAFDEAVHGYLTPEHWWSVLPRRFVLAVLSALAVLAIALAGGAVRLGPPLIPPAQRAPTSAEYVDALAALYERAGATGKALIDAFRSTKRVVAGSVGLPDDAPVPELAARLERADLRSALVDLKALTSSARADDVSLVRGLGLAHVLRKELGTHGRGR